MSTNRYQERLKLRKVKAAMIGVIIVCTIVMVSCVGLSISIKLFYQKQFELLKSEREQLEQELIRREDQIIELSTQLDQINETADMVNSDAPETTTTSSPANIGVSTFTADEEYIIDKYSYVLYDTMNNRNDMTEELILYGYDLANKLHFNPDLLFGIIKVESEGKVDAVNTITGATGLGQLIDNTGEWICKDIIGIDYDPETTPYDPEANMLIVSTYLNYLYNKYNGSTMDVIKEYSGSTTFDGAYQYYMKVSNACGYCIE